MSLRQHLCWFISISCLPLLAVGTLVHLVYCPVEGVRKDRRKATAGFNAPLRSPLVHAAPANPLISPPPRLKLFSPVGSLPSVPFVFRPHTQSPFLFCIPGPFSFSSVVPSAMNSPSPVCGALHFLLSFYISLSPPLSSSLFFLCSFSGCCVVSARPLLSWSAGFLSTGTE